MTALMYACINGRHGCAHALIDASAAVDEVDDKGTALVLACAEGHHECAQALIDAGASVDMVDNYGIKALMSLPASLCSLEACWLVDNQYEMQPWYR